jgi:NAD(P)-dependent dehydrogenase (short-subunit alcohol dehydrogenase family)
MGSTVVIADLSAERLKAVVDGYGELPGTLSSVCADVTDPAAMRGMAETVMEKYGRIDGLVTCAGAYRPKGSSLEVSLDEWRLITDSNLMGTYLACQAVLPHMVAAGKGAIVTISSLAGRTCSPFLGVHYSAAKAGVLGVTRHFATEFGPHGIRVNSVAPGTTYGDRVSEIVDPGAAEAMAAATPLRRLAEGSDVSGVALFLLSDLASFVTGATVDANGGYLTI